MIDIINSLRGWLSLVGPIITTIIAIVTTYGILKWGTKTIVAVKEIFTDPLKVLFFFMVLVLFFVAYFKYVQPIL